MPTSQKKDSHHHVITTKTTEIVTEEKLKNCFSVFVVVVTPDRDLSVFVSLFHDAKMHILGGQTGRHTEEHRMMFKYGFFSRICSCSGLGLLFTSYVAPYWVTHYTYRISIGLWSPCVRNVCKDFVNKPYMFRIVWILMSISVVFGVVAVSLSFLTNTSGKSVKWPLIANLSTGLMSLATMMLFGLMMHLNVRDPNTRHFIQFNWAYWVGCLATAFFLMSGVLYILIALSDNIAKPKRPKNYEKKEQPSEELRKNERETVKKVITA